MKRLAEYSLLAALSVFLFIRGVVPAWNEVHSDFANYYVSAKLVTEGKALDRLYDNEWFQQKIYEYEIETQGKFSPFPPITAWVMIPLTSFRPLTAQRIFTIINLCFILIGIYLLKEITDWQFHLCALLILGSGFSLINNIAFGQLYWIMTVSILSAILLLDKNQPFIAGALLAIFISLKYFPIVLVAGYFLNGFMKSKGALTSFSSTDIRVALLSIFVLLTIIFGEFFYFGNAVMNEFFFSTFLPHLDGKLNGQGLYSFHYQSWDNLFRNLFLKDIEYNPNPLIDWSTGKTVLKIFVMLIVTGWISFVVYKHKSAAASVRRAIYLTVLSLGALVLLPASATYHFTLLLIPLSLIIGYHLIDSKLIVLSIAVYCLIGFIPYGTAFRIGGEWGIFFGYPRLWLLSTLFIVVMIGLNKKELNFGE